MPLSHIFLLAHLFRKNESQKQTFVQIHPLALDMEPSGGRQPSYKRLNFSIIQTVFLGRKTTFLKFRSTTLKHCRRFQSGTQTESRRTTHRFPQEVVLYNEWRYIIQDPSADTNGSLTKADRALGDGGFNTELPSPFGKRRPYDFFHIYKKVAFRILIRL